MTKHREKLFFCETCDHKSFRLCDLNKHRRTHNTFKKFACMFCNYRSHEKRRLEIHTRKHTGEAHEYACEWDGCRFSSPDKCKLVIHKRKHTFERPFECFWPGCEHKCSERSKLNVHMRTHEYRCSMCDFKCPKSEHLNIKIHMIVHKKEVEFKRHIVTLCEQPDLYIDMIDEAEYLMDYDFPQILNDCIDLIN